MSNIQKAFKTKAKRGLCMAAGGFLSGDPIKDAVVDGSVGNFGQTSSMQGGTAPMMAGQTAVAPGNEWGGGFRSMDFDAMKDMNSLDRLPTLADRGGANSFYGGRLGGDPHFSGSTSRVLQEAQLGSPRRGLAHNGYIAPPRNNPVQSTMTPVDDMFQPRQRMAEGGLVETPEQTIARMAQKYGTTGSSGSQQDIPAAPAPAVAPAPQKPATTLRGAFDALRGRTAQIDKATNLAHGGVVEAQGGDVLPIRGPGTGKSDDVQAVLDGTQVNVSNGEKLVVVPAKTAKNPEAMQAMLGVMQAGNDGIAPRGLRQGGSYADGSWFDKARGMVADGAEWVANKVSPAAAPAPEAAPAAPAPGAAPAQPRQSIRGTPFEVNGSLSADGRAATANARAMANTNLRAPTTVVGQLGEGLKDVGQTVGKGLQKVAAVANNPLVRNAGYTGVALSAIEPAIETMQDKNQIRLDHPDSADNPLGAMASRTGEVLANTADLGLKAVDNLSDVTRLPMNWAVKSLGGPENYFRGRAASNALHAAVGAPPTVGTGPRSVRAQTGYGDAPAAGKWEEPAIGDAPAAGKWEEPATAAAPTTPNAAPNNDIQVRTIRLPDGRMQKEFSGKNVTQTYTGADGKPTTNWEDTKDFKDAQVRAGKDQALLKKYEEWGAASDIKSTNPVYHERGLRRQAALDQNNRTDVAKRLADAEAAYKQGDLNVKREGLGIQREDLALRRSQEARALATAQRQAEKDLVEQQRKAREDMDKDEEHVRKTFAGHFLTKDDKGNQVEDKAALDDFLRHVNHTITEEGKNTQDARLWDKVAGRPRNFAQMDKTTQDFLLNRYNALRRFKEVQGWMPGYASKANTLNLFDLDAQENGDDVVFPRLSKKHGTSIRAQKKDFMYDKPIGMFDLQALQTPNDTLLRNLYGK